MLLDSVALYILNLPSNLVLSFCSVQDRMLLIDWFSFLKNVGIRRYIYMLSVGCIFPLFSNIFTEITRDMDKSKENCILSGRALFKTEFKLGLKLSLDPMFL